MLGKKRRERGILIEVGNFINEQLEEQEKRDPTQVLTSNVRVLLCFKCFAN